MMDKSLSVQVVNQGTTTKAVLSGEITEESDFSPLLDLRTKTVILDLGDIRRINSTGVREWIKFVASLARSGRALHLERCSVAIVQQLNMISNFRGGGNVRSVLAPYHCDECDDDYLHLVDLSKGQGTSIAFRLPCPRCGASMDFDEIPESYLAFRDL